MKEAWLLLLQPHSELVTREVARHHEEVGNGDVHIPSRCYKLFTEFHDIFDPLSIPVDRDTVHYIELLPNAKPHYRC